MFIQEYLRSEANRSFKPSAGQPRDVGRNWVRFVDGIHFFARERREEVRLRGY